MASYAKVKKIFDRERLDIFGMAVSYLMDIGWRTAIEITDEEIKEVEGNGLMTQEFCQYLCKLAREIAQSCSPTQLIQLCEAEEIFELRHSAGKVSRRTLEEGLTNAIHFYLRDMLYNNENYDSVCEEFNILEEDMELLGFEYNYEEDAI